MKTIIRKHLAYARALILAAVVCAGCKPAHTTKEVNVGIIVPLTGGAADFGKWARNGADLAVTDVNQQSAANGFTIRCIYEDHQMDAKLGLSAFKKLTDIDKAIAVVTAGSGVVLAIAPEAERTHTLQINYGAVSPAIRKSGDYDFTLVNDADVETDEIARLAAQTLGIKSLAVLYANTAYGVTTKDAIVRSFKKVGGEIAGTVAFPENFTDIRAQLTQLKELNPPAVYFIATIKDSGKLLKQAQELGFKTQWLTYNAFESPEVLQIAGSAADGVIYTSSNLYDLPDPGTNAMKFLDAYISKYGERPSLYAATAYDAIRLIALAQSSSDKSKEGMQKFFAAIRGYQGASGDITFDSDGCVTKPVFLKVVRNGQFALY
jgi:branched-chain amino acid transport system substrate-binding protein